MVSPTPQVWELWTWTLRPGQICHPWTLVVSPMPASGPTTRVRRASWSLEVVSRTVGCAMIIDTAIITKTNCESQLNFLSFVQVHINDVAFLPFSTMTWNYDVPPMNEARFGHRMTHVDGYAYVVAGYDTSLKCSAELWDESSHQWIDHLNDLQYCRWVFGLPTYVPKTEITCS